MSCILLNFNTQCKFFLLVCDVFCWTEAVHLLWTLADFNLASRQELQQQLDLVLVEATLYRLRFNLLARHRLFYKLFPLCPGMYVKIELFKNVKWPNGFNLLALAFFLFLFLALSLSLFSFSSLCRVHKLTITSMHLSVQCQVNSRKLVLKAFPCCKIDYQLLILLRFLLNSTRYH